MPCVSRVVRIMYHSRDEQRLHWYHSRARTAFKTYPIAQGSGGLEGLPSIDSACRRCPLRKVVVNWLQPHTFSLCSLSHRSVRWPSPSSVSFRHQLRSRVSNPAAKFSAIDTSARSEMAEALFSERCCSGVPSPQHLATVANVASVSSGPQPSNDSVCKLMPHFCTCKRTNPITFPALND